MSLAATDSLLGMSKMGDLKRRLLFLLGALVVFRIGTFIPVPGIDPEQLAELIGAARFRFIGLTTEYAKGPQPMSYVYLGRARPA